MEKTNGLLMIFGNGSGNFDILRVKTGDKFLGKRTVITLQQQFFKEVNCI